MLHKITIDQRTRPLANPFQIVAVRPFFWPLNQPGGHRVQMDIAAQMQRILIITDFNAFGAAFKQGAAALLLLVKSLRITAEQTLNETTGRIV